MQGIDLNLLPQLRALLEEEHVTRAAERMHLSVPAMSRALERCRRTFGDPLLVRSGRNVVITPRGREVLAELVPVMASIDALTVRPEPFDPAALRRRFTIRANEAVIASLGSPLLAHLGDEAPDVELRFQFESDDDLDRLRDGTVDLAIGGYSQRAGDLHTEHLADETLVGVVRTGTPVSRPGLGRFAGLDHVVVSRRGRARGPIDDLLAGHGLERRVVAVVPSFSAAIALVAQSDAVTVAPRRFVAVLGGFATFRVPLDLPVVDVVQMWHERADADAASAWLRGRVSAVARRLR